jgi:4-hydroxyphenylpyruvate dioxygenase-like putative hemolysin
LEFIERRGATGFGAGNIRILWKIVQQQINGET